MDLDALQRAAEAEGRACVVGALILDGKGRVFVHRRGWDRSFLPGCWDVVGGHVEPGETLLEALAREVREETGWTVTGTPAHVHTLDWLEDEADPTSRRREFDFLVAVEGDLSRPRLEWPQHVEWRWIGPNETELLDENRGLDHGMVRELVELAFTLAPPIGLS